MRIHLVSDVHTEFGLDKKRLPRPDLDVDTIVLAGDIGLVYPWKQREVLALYLDACRRVADNVIWVLGNHEFYHGQYEEVFKLADDLAYNMDIHLMDQYLSTDRIEIDGVKFWGTTFWTDMQENDWYVKQEVRKSISDFHVIHKQFLTEDMQFGLKLFHPDDVVEINNRSRELLMKNLDADVIITHHAPFYIRHPVFKRTKITEYFYNNGLIDTILDSSVKYWLYGHTHHSYQIDMNGTLVMSNQMGYGTQFETAYDDMLVFEV